MTIAVRANGEQKKEFLSKKIPGAVELVWLQKSDTLQLVNADIYFDLLFGDVLHQASENKPVVVNAVVVTAKELPKNYIRINAWPGFLEREITEFAVGAEGEKQAKQVFQELGWKYKQTADVPGMITARIICKIINEAYFALGEGISTKEEIDIAMKLGTNYPYGPFEWGEKIELKNVYRLLKKLSKEDESYAIAPKLEEEAGR
ncbi:MAG: 3-hydroxyacyl-CoA dehydrogenase family protein [Ilyomonas sp.]